MSTDRGWAEMPGGGLLGALIADAFGRAAASGLTPASDAEQANVDELA